MRHVRFAVALMSIALAAGCGGKGADDARWGSPGADAPVSGAASPSIGSTATAQPGASPGTTPGASPAADRSAAPKPAKPAPPPGRPGAPGAGAPFKGVANAACADLTRLGVSWYYNWTLDPGTCRAPGFVPMISGKNEKTAGAVSSALARVSRAGHRTVLGFNEPNKVDQSNLTVQQVVALWPHVTADPAVRVGSPATSADAQAWFTQFMAEVETRRLRVDFVAIHWYGWNAGSCDAKAEALERYVRWAESVAGNRPIWITEWGCMHQSNADPAAVRAFYTAALAMFARHPRIERYAWYPWNTHNELVSSAGQLTTLGAALAGAPAHR